MQVLLRIIIPFFFLMGGTKNYAQIEHSIGSSYNYIQNMEYRESSSAKQKDGGQGVSVFYDLTAFDRWYYKAQFSRYLLDFNDLSTPDKAKKNFFTLSFGYFLFSKKEDPFFKYLVGLSLASEFGNGIGFPFFKGTSPAGFDFEIHYRLNNRMKFFWGSQFLFNQRTNEVNGVKRLLSLSIGVKYFWKKRIVK